MRIGIDAGPLAVPFGGIRRYTERLVRALARVDDRNEYVLHAPAECRGLPRVAPHVAWEVSRLPLKLKGWLDLVQLPGGEASLDLFHGTNYTAPLATRVPTVLTVHDLTVHLFPEHHPWRRRLRHRLLPALCRRAARIIADSYCTKGDLVEHYGIPEEKIDVVYLAAGEEFRPVGCMETLERVRERYALPEAFVLFVGSVEPRKNLPRLVRAMTTLVREGVEQRLVIAGDGERGYVSELRQLVRSEGLELGRDVLLPGAVPDEDLPALYSLADLFVYPSRYEGFGLPPLEAMACGAPVLLPDHSSFRELYRDCSLMLDLEQPDALVDAMRRLLWDPVLRDELVERGQKLARSRSWEDTALETLEVYRRVTP
jgi:glycosyltransferase involved in cell wall biosynthesis